MILDGELINEQGHDYLMEALNFPDNTWVDVTGEIIKWDYHGDIAVIKVSNMFEIDKPENEFVTPPDDTYIPTSNLF